MTDARHDPVKAEITKMEQEILLRINQAHKETVRMICWDYAGQVEIVKSLSSAEKQNLERESTLSVVCVEGGLYLPMC